MSNARPVARTTAIASSVVLAFVVSLYLLWAVRSVVVIVGFSAFVALALGPLVDVVGRRAHLPRWAATLGVYLMLTLTIVGVGLVVVPPVVTGVASLSTDAPHYIDDLRQNRTFRHYDNQYHLSKKLNEQAAQLPSRLGSAASTLSDVTVGVFSAVVQLVTVLTIAFFLILDGGRIVDRALFLAFREERAERWKLLCDDVYRSVSGYVAGNFAISLMAGAVAYVTLLALSVPFALPLALLMAFFDVIPLVGSTIGAGIITLVTLFNGFPTTTIVWVVVALVYQQVENSVLTPIVYRQTVKVSGLVTVVAVLIGAQLLGILGALVAIPAAAAIDIVGREIWAIHNSKERLADGAVLLSPDVLP